jgi:hypothetical protein
MFRKTNIRILVILLVLLLIGVAVQQFIDTRKGERSFAARIMDFDTAKVSQVVMENFRPSFRLTRIYKRGQAWLVERDNKSYAADPTVVSEMLAGLANLSPERVAATEKSQWGTYEVGDSNGMHIRLSGKNNKELAGLVLGKFSYQQPTNPYDRQGKLTSYVRPANKEVVYAVNGFLQISFSDDLNSLRDKSIIRFTGSNDWTRLNFSYPGDSSFIMSRQGSQWLINGLATDSARVVRYLSQLTPLTSSYFIYDKEVSTSPTHSLTIEGNKIPGVVIQAFPADSVNHYLIRSNQNPDALFSGAEKKLFENLFRGKSYFMKH